MSPFVVGAVKCRRMQWGGNTAGRGRHGGLGHLVSKETNVR